MEQWLTAVNKKAIDHKALLDKEFEAFGQIEDMELGCAASNASASRLPSVVPLLARSFREESQ